MTTETGASLASGLVVKKVAAIKHRFESLVRDVKAIRDSGREARDPDGIDAFLGAYVDITNRFEKCETCFFELEEYCIANLYYDFPTPRDRELLADAKRYKLESNVMHINIMRARPNQTIGDATNSGNNSTIIQMPIVPKLPDISLPTFAGDILSWPFFRDSFKATIHDKSEINKIDKFSYLLGVLRSPALDIVKSIPLSEANYDVVWKRLLDRYDNQRHLASAYVHQILNAKSLPRASISSLELFISTVVAAADNFKRLNITDREDYLLFELLVRHLDPVTRQNFESAHSKTTHPTFTQLKTYLETQLQQLSCASLGSGPSARPNVPVRPNKFSRGKSTALHTYSSSVQGRSGRSQSPPKRLPTCFVCRSDHSIQNCPLFQSASPSQRLDMLQQWYGCKNCLLGGHWARQCNKKPSCTKCTYKHHTMLHVRDTPTEHGGRVEPPEVAGPSTPDTVALTNTLLTTHRSMLGTALASMRDCNGVYQTFRLILDSGSQNSYITHSCAKRLGLPVKHQPCYVSGLNDAHVSKSQGTVKCAIKPLNSNLQFFSIAHAIPIITPMLPREPLPVESFLSLPKVNLADPSFWTPGEVDFLLGADLFIKILNSQSTHPFLLNTVFGHVVMGPLGTNNTQALSFFALPQLNDLVSRFWELESVNSVIPTSLDDERSEFLFKTTTYREPSGRYVVALPFRDNEPQVHCSPKQALSRLHSLEKKCKKDISLKTNYHQFMLQYLELGHMQLATAPSKFIIPHHPVVKLDINKFRIVFDGSARVGGVSLNDTLLRGPILQQDIADIILRFRTHRVVFTADIKKMYRQIVVRPQDRPYQHILWRFNETDPVQCYELCRVVYGLTSSPYQSLRVIKQLIMDEGAHFPHAANALNSDMYIDDIATGTDSISEAAILKDQIKGLLIKGCFELSKWACNVPAIIENEETLSQQTVEMSDSDPNLVPHIKILGLVWAPNQDYFSFFVSQPSLDIIYTKRLILSTIARIYDRLGFLAPVILTAKWIFQEVCKHKCEWDDGVPEVLASQWLDFIKHLPRLSELSIPRYIGNVRTSHCYILGFCDASQKGFCAALYVYTSHTTLLTAKTRLAPIKVTTIPRLELCGALLLSQLLHSINPFLNSLNSYEIYLFTDSSVVLAWLATPPYNLKTFVAHRVVTILERTDLSMWYHINTDENPADCGSRGLYPHELGSHSLWWNGPSWLRLPIAQWPIQSRLHNVEVGDELYAKEIKEDCAVSLTSTNPSRSEFIQWTERFSNYMRLVRSWAYVLRFLSRFKMPIHGTVSTPYKGEITSDELRFARNHCVILVQKYYFAEFFSSKNNSKQLLRLGVYQDEEGILRVGGRLSKSGLPYDQRHPILLPRDAHISLILVRFYHNTTCHVGSSALQAIIQQQYWILSLRNLCRKVKRQCITCIRWKREIRAPYMGDLPTLRFQEKSAFHHTAVDFAGPFLLRETARRKATLVKTYLCLFVCLSTKAVHLEVCNSLSTEALIDVLEKFIARRGRPAIMLSDNGTNFVGTVNYYRELVKWLDDDDTQASLLKYTAPMGIQWNFNPPRSPHFGGLFEAGVKSAKQLLLKLMGNQSLTYHEFTVIVAKVEGVLNSRPLYPTSTDPDDLQPLTPAHFLVGGPIHALPEESLLGVPSNRLSRWQLIRERAQVFWKRWRNEYLYHLTLRNKWYQKLVNYEEGDIVLVQDTPSSSPYSFPYARIVEIHPGEDGVVRVVTLRVASGKTLKRNVHNLISLKPLLHEH